MKKRGFTLIEMLCAAAIACVFVMSVLSILTMFGYGGKFLKAKKLKQEQTETSLFFNEFSKKLSSKGFLEKALDFKGASDIDSGDDDCAIAIKIDNLPASVCGTDNVVVGQVGLAAVDFSIGLKKGDFALSWNDDMSTKYFDRTILPLQHGVKEIYFRPVFTKKYDKKNYPKGLWGSEHWYSSKLPAPNSWNNDQKVQFNHVNFKKLIELKKKGEVKRVYVVIQ